MSKTLSVVFLLAFVLASANSFAQILRRDGGAGTFPSSRSGQYDPFDNDSLGGEPKDTSKQLIAQNTDTINFVKVVRRYDLNLEQHAPKLSLDSVHQYQPIFQAPEPIINLGNNGLPILQLTKEFNYSPDLEMYGGAFNPYFYHTDDVKYYRAQRPYTRLKYVTGSERENNFEFEHTQNWGRGLNVGVQYERLVSEGFYENQEIDHRNTAMHVWYQGKRKHFNSMAHYISNKSLIGANGGIVPNDTLDYFTTNDYNQRKNIPVFLTTSENKRKGGQFNWQNSYDFGKNVKVKINDTISDTQIVPRFRVQHTLNIHNADNNYRSSTLDTNYFAQTYIADTLITRDTLNVKRLSNEFRIKWLGNKLGDSSMLVRQNFLADAFARFSTTDVDQIQGNSDSFSDLVVGGNFRSNPLDSPKIIYRAQGAYHLTDYRQGDYFVRGDAGFDLNLTGKLVGFVELTNQSQPYTANKFYQTHYQFNNDLDKLNSRVIGGYFSNKDLKLNATVRFANSDNILYYDADRNPKLSGSAVSYVMAHVGKQFQVKKFYLDVNGYYQKSSDEEAIRLPDIVAKAETYYKGPLFKNKVIAKIGLNGLYYSPYDLNGFDPALQQFYNQNIQSEYDNKPQIGFFSNFQLSRARVFLRLDNITAPLVDEPIYQGFAYPQHNLAFRAGINWVFVN